ncbi:E3 ubiquitin-protein ligase RHA2A-like [Henckelia pumila]|uniref:E3 ubiquitin-protein ligase RHA2A-like n=1 Tax=Henckelia pumila TaxID=405737 RepID=UPI003C6E09B9
MGLHNYQLSGSDSILIVATVVIANCLRYVHSVVSTTLRTVGLLSPRLDPAHDQYHQVVGSGLANLILLCNQLSKNRESSYPNGLDSDCVVCLNPLQVEGEDLRELACGHVFHKDCFAGWLDQLNFNCPVCREPLAQPPDEYRLLLERQVAGDLLSWFPFQ